MLRLGGEGGGVEADDGVLDGAGVAGEAGEEPGLDGGGDAELAIGQEPGEEQLEERGVGGARWRRRRWRGGGWPGPAGGRGCGPGRRG